MKTKLLFLTALISIAGFSQTAVPSFYTPDGSLYGEATTSVPLSQDAAGANITWNFSNLSTVGSAFDEAESPTPTEIANFPNSTAVSVTTSTISGTTTVSRIYSYTSSGNTIVAGADSNGLVLKYGTDAASLGAFPKNYSATTTDATAGTYTYQTYSGSFTGTIVTSIDAYGTLNLTDGGVGSYSGAVTRLKNVQNISLSYFPFGVVGTVVITTYQYYSDTNFSTAPVFRNTTTAVNVPALSLNQTTSQIEYFQGILLATNPLIQQNKITIAPNPVDQFLNIQSGNSIISAISISDSNGKQILQMNNPGNSINVSQLRHGVYFASVTTSSGTVVYKIIKK